MVSLGVPIGNDMNHTKWCWWEKKIQATRDKANRWAGLYRSSFFGRNLVVQAMYFGRLRWLAFFEFIAPFHMTGGRVKACRDTVRPRVYG